MYYVGITSKDNPKDRWGKNGEGYKGQVFYNAIQKYGWDNIQHKILYSKNTKEKAEEKEKELIKYYNSLCGHSGYNVTEGGNVSSVERRYNANVQSVYDVENNVAYWSSTYCASQTGITDSAKSPLL